MYNKTMYKKLRQHEIGVEKACISMKIPDYISVKTEKSYRFLINLFVKKIQAKTLFFKNWRITSEDLIIL